AGNTLGAHLDFIRKIQEHTQIEECSEENCDVIVAFCPVSSRIGTDIDAALLQVSDYKPAILVVMHHTYDQDAIVVDSARLVKKNNVKLSVDCLFFENRGLLENCSINERGFSQLGAFFSQQMDQITKYKKWLKKHS
uniref:Uncharacterized protein n=1 Tax=Lepisosteus oculatus TaxID=7918 RepID=W5LYT4_LEPOC